MIAEIVIGRGVRVRLDGKEARKPWSIDEQEHGYLCHDCHMGDLELQEIILDITLASLLGDDDEPQDPKTLTLKINEGTWSGPVVAVSSTPLEQDEDLSGFVVYLKGNLTRTSYC